MQTFPSVRSEVRKCLMVSCAYLSVSKNEIVTYTNYLCRPYSYNPDGFLFYLTRLGKSQEELTIGLTDDWSELWDSTLVQLVPSRILLDPFPRRLYYLLFVCLPFPEVLSRCPAGTSLKMF